MYLSKRNLNFTNSSFLRGVKNKKRDPWDRKNSERGTKWLLTEIKQFHVLKFRPEKGEFLSEPKPI